MLVCWNGQLVDDDKVSIGSMGRSFWFADGVFTTLRVEEGEIIAFQEHMIRLKREAAMIEIDCPKISKSDLEHYLTKKQCLQGTYRLKIMIVPEGSTGKPLWEGKRQASYIARVDRYIASTQALRVIVYPKALELPILSIKSNSYAHRLWLRKWAYDKGYDDALCLDSDGNVLELATSAIFWKAGNAYYAPDASKLPIINSVGLKALPFELQPIIIALKDVPKEWEPYSCNALNTCQKILEITCSS